MTETTKTIFEKYQVRKTKQQKTNFINWIKSIASKANYDVNIERGLFGARNIVIGNPKTAKVIYTAHYDTCAVLPFPNFITPQNPIFYFLYQIVLMFILTLILFILTMILYFLGIPYSVLITELSLWIIIGFMLFGPANKHTSNDNTSGVTVVIDVLNAMPEEYRDNAAFVLFDLEEAGLLGSFSYRIKHNKVMKKKILINFDCVSDGNNLLFVVKRKAKQFIPMLKNAFKESNDYTIKVLTNGVFYPSDQAIFPFGIGVAALKKTRFFNILYMNRIHTKRDVIYNEKNIDFLVSGAVALTKNLATHLEL